MFFTALFSGCKFDPVPPKNTPYISNADFEQWKADNVILLGNNRYLLQGRTLVPDESYIAGYYERFVAQQKKTRATVYVTENNTWSVWPNDIKGNITYCISDDFGGAKNRVKSRIEKAIKAWESACSVDFVHKPEEDIHATAGNTNVVFNVRPATYLEEAGVKPDELKLFGIQAYSFYPHYDRYHRELILFSFTLAHNDDELRCIIKHEFGHILGLTDSTNPISSIAGGIDIYPGDVIIGYDTDSIMYCYYASGYTGDLGLSAGDCEAIHKIYHYTTVGINRHGPHGGDGGGSFSTPPDIYKKRTIVYTENREKTFHE